MKMSLAFVLTVASTVSLFAADIYVDSLANSSGDGSLSSPYLTIREGVLAAGTGDTVWVRGGDNRAYTIATSGDAFAFAVAGVSLRGCDANWNPITNYLQTSSMPLIPISSTYAKDCKAADGAVTDPIGVTADNATISGFKFTFGKNSFKQQNQGGHGLICAQSVTGMTIAACDFTMTDATGSYDGAGTQGIIYGSVANNKYTVANVTVRNCSFWLGKYRAQIVPFSSLCGDFSVSECKFENLDRLYTSSGNNNGVSFTFVSNIVLNCANESNNYKMEFLPHGGNFYPQHAEIAYNRFIHDDGSTLRHIVIGHGGGYGNSFYGNVSIHHNTVVGYDSFLYARPYNDGHVDTWTPHVFSNIILPNEGGMVLNDPSTKLNSGMTCSFKEGSTFFNNAYSGTLDGGDATTLDGYDLSTLDQQHNIVLTAPPLFMETADWTSPDYYRFRSNMVDWAYYGWTGENGEYPNYIGAVEPLYVPPATIIRLL